MTSKLHSPVLPQLAFGRGAAAAFTLVEVLLAIFIALGILVVLLYFYEQATNLRAEIIRQTELISTARLLMDRMTGELRSVASEPSVGQPFSGTSNSLRFVKADVPSFGTWLGGALGRSSFPVTDLKLIQYRLESVDGTNVAGLVRSEEPAVARTQQSSEDEVATSSVSTNGAAPVVIGEIRFLQFRYWSGTNWLDSWSGFAPPAGVEVSLGSEPATNITESTDYNPDVFRRVLYLGFSTAGQGPSATRLMAVTNTPSGEEAP